MVVRLVAMRILADETRNVGRRVVGQGRGAVEQRVELFLKRRIAAEMVDQPIDVMLVEEGRLPAVRFGIVAPLARIMPDLDRIIILPPAAVLEARAREAGPGVDDVAIVARTLAQDRKSTRLNSSH